MEKCVSIINEIEKHVLLQGETRLGGTDDEI
jgi:hypothetical protein